MDESREEKETKKVVYISSVIVAPFLLLLYWQSILRIAFVGGITFGLTFLLVRYRNTLHGKGKEVLRWLSCHMNRRRKESL